MIGDLGFWQIKKAVGRLGLNVTLREVRYGLELAMRDGLVAKDLSSSRAHPRFYAVSDADVAKVIAESLKNVERVVSSEEIQYEQVAG